MHARTAMLAMFPLLALACGARSELIAPDVGVRDALNVAAPDVGVRDVVVRDVVVRDVDDVPAVPDAITSRCGNGVLEPGEQCDLGPNNRLVPAFTVMQGVLESPIRLVVRHQSAAAFYDYRSASAHTGFEAPGISLLFLYCDAAAADQLGLFTIHGRDDLGGAHQPSSSVHAQLTGVPAGVTIAVSDDPDEFLATPGVPGAFEGRWTFNDNTDGGALTGLPWDRAWTITMVESFTAGVDAWRAIDGDGHFRTLDVAMPTLLIHRVVPSACRPDCRVPRCGDGYIDAGERCDDGNEVSGDGCSADCGTIE